MLYKDIYSFTPTEKIENDIKVFLLKYKKELTYKHSIRVANEARKIAIKYHENEEKAAMAAYLALILVQSFRMKSGLKLLKNLE
ncbi:HD domain protein [Bacillus cereus G9241]|nr:HD domain protein [Bacillus cereus G9241]